MMNIWGFILIGIFLLALYFVYKVIVRVWIRPKSLSRDDLDHFIQKTIDESPKNAELDKEVRFLQNAMEFSNVKVRDCMLPRTEIVAVGLDTKVEDLRAQFIETGLSKIVVYKDEIDNVVGYIHSSEMFRHADDWTKAIVTLPFIPETMSASKLMKMMLAEKKNMAIIVDEFGGTSGLVTLEDLVEEIFGEIEDEHDNKLLVSKRVGEGEYVLSGRMEIDQVNERFGLSIPESDEYQTIAGYILNAYQKFPKVNETLNIDGYEFKIVKMTSAKIELVRLKTSKQ